MMVSSSGVARSMGSMGSVAVDLLSSAASAARSQAIPARSSSTTAWTAPVFDACYSSCYGGCYGGRRHGLFSCLFGHKRRASWHCPPPVPTCFSSYALACYGGGYMGTPVFGDYTPAYVSGQSIGSGQIIGAPQGYAPVGGTTPAATAPVPSTDATPPPPPLPDESSTPAPDTEPAPAPDTEPAP